MRSLEFECLQYSYSPFIQALSKFALSIKKLEKDKRKIMEKVTRDGKQDAPSDKNIDVLGSIEENLVQLRTFEELLHSYKKYA